MKTFILSMILMLALPFLHSCDLPDDGPPDGCENETEYYSLTGKNYIPYKGYDTINLVSKAGDTIHCISGAIQLFYVHDFEKHSNPACGPNGIEKLYEANKFLFTDSLKGNTIELINYEHYPSEPYENWPMVAIKFKTREFFILTYQISSPEADNYFGDVDINGKNYLSVQKVNLQGWDSTYFLLLNNTDGIIKIQLGSDEIWEVIGN